MKKLIVIALAFLVAGSVSASTMPTCGEGSHYEGSYVETETCNRVCTKKFFGMCLKYENVCTTSGSWEGGCVSNPVEEPIEEPIDEPADETGEEETDEPVVTPVVVTGGGSNAWFTLLPKIVAENYYYENGVFHFLSSYRTEGFVSVEKPNGSVDIYEEGKEYVFHSVTLNLEAGEYKVTAFTKSGTETVMGQSITVTVE